MISLTFYSDGVSRVKPFLQFLSIPGIVIVKRITRAVRLVLKQPARLGARHFAHVRELFGDRLAVALRALDALAGLTQTLLRAAEQRRKAAQIGAHRRKQRRNLPGALLDRQRPKAHLQAG